jgi:leucyl/phenylalanyl-tRNA--protein transferase
MMQQTFDQSGSSSAECPEMKQGGPLAAVIMRSVLKATSRFFFRGLIFPFIEPARLVEVVVGSSSSPSVHAGDAASRLEGFITPSPADILGNYLRGKVLFGADHGTWRGFKWWNIQEKAVITRESAHIPRRVATYMRQGGYRIRYDHDLSGIMHACARRSLTWITPEIIALYEELETMGYCSCVGVYRDDVLVGGLWGIAAGSTFGLMSMFHFENRAGSLALASLVSTLAAGGRWNLIDVGGMNDNFKRYGAFVIAGKEFKRIVLRDLAAGGTPPETGPCEPRTSRRGTTPDNRNH